MLTKLVLPSSGTTFYQMICPLKDAVIKWGKVKMFILQTRLFTYNYLGE
jgi:hypothetical protein